MLALQIKAGKSYFHKTINKKSISYRGDNQHLDLWLKYSIPVLITVFDEESNEAYWQLIHETNIKRGKKSWKISIPLHQKFDFKNIGILRDISREPNTYLANLFRLQQAKYIISKLNEGEIWYLYADIVPGFRDGIGLPIKVKVSFSRDELEQDVCPKYAFADYYLWNFITYSKLDVLEFLKKSIPWANIKFIGAQTEGELIEETINSFSSFCESEDDFRKMKKECENLCLTQVCDYFDCQFEIKATLHINSFEKNFLRIDSYLAKSIIGFGEVVK